MLFITVTFFLLCIYYFFGWSYSKGMSEYVRLNNNHSYECENTWKSVSSEYEELIEAIKAKNLWEIFMEFFDVVHVTIKSIIVTFTPRMFYYNRLLWIVMFPLLLPATIKLGHRYNKYKCIRNHSRNNKDHNCIINQYLCTK